MIMKLTNFIRIFGEHIGTSDWYRRRLNQLKNDKDGVISFRCIDSYGNVIGERFVNKAWELLGRYITNNTHLQTLSIMFCNLTDEKMHVK